MEEQSGPYSKPFEWYLKYGGKYRKAIVDSTGMRVAEALGGPLGWAASKGVSAGLDSLSEPLTDRGFYQAVLRGPRSGTQHYLRNNKDRKELAESSRLISARWAKQYAQQLGKGLGDASADGLLVSMATLNRQSFPDRVKWQILYSAAGLPQGEAQSVTQVAINRLNAYLGSRRAPSMTDLARDMGKVYLSRRAQRVLYNEDAVAQNFGRQILFMNAVAKGYLPPDTQKVWLTAVDERVCPVCAPMDSVAVNIDEPFHIRSHKGVLHHDAKLWVPPAHTNCRCTVQARPSVEHGVITRTARFSSANPTASDWPIPARFDQSRARLRSSMGDIVEQGTNPPWMSR